MTATKDTVSPEYTEAARQCGLPLVVVGQVDEATTYDDDEPTARPGGRTGTNDVPSALSFWSTNSREGGGRREEMGGKSQ